MCIVYYVYRSSFPSALHHAGIQTTICFKTRGCASQADKKTDESAIWNSMNKSQVSSLLARPVQCAIEIKVGVLDDFISKLMLLLNRSKTTRISKQTFSKQFNLKAQSTRHSRVFNYALMHHSSPICCVVRGKNVCATRLQQQTTNASKVQESCDVAKLFTLECVTWNRHQKLKNAVFSLDDKTTCNNAVSMRTQAFTLPRKRANSR